MSEMQPFSKIKVYNESYVMTEDDTWTILIPGGEKRNEFETRRQTSPTCHKYQPKTRLT